MKSKAQANVAVHDTNSLDTPFDVTESENTNACFDQSMMANMCNEVFKMVQAKINTIGSSVESTNFVGIHIPTHALTCLPHNDHIQHEWIVDIGTSYHIKLFYELFY